MPIDDQIIIPAQVKGAMSSGAGGGGDVTLPIDISDVTGLQTGLDNLAAPQYVVLSTSVDLDNERILTGTTNQIIITDGGAGSTVTISTPQNIDTGASPQFAAINVGHASDTTITRTGAGVIAVEGVEVTTNSATQTLSNKTLTAPKLVDGGFIADANGNEGLILVTTASAVNEVTLTPAATGNHPKLAATGGDTNINLQLAGKGTGGVAPQGTGGTGHFVRQVVANGPLSSSALVDADLPSTSNNSTISAISTVANAALPKAGGTLTGPLIHADTTPPAGSNTFACSQSSIHIVNGANGGRLRTNGGDSLIWSSSGLSSPGPLIMSDTTAPAGTNTYSCAVSGYNVQNGAGGGRLRVAGTNVLSYETSGVTIHNGILTFAGATTISGNAIGRNTNGHTEIASPAAIILNPTSAIYAYKPLAFANSQNNPGSSVSCLFYETAQRLVLQSGTGTLVRRNKMVTRVNSVAYSIESIATGDKATAVIRDSLDREATAKISTSQVVTFEAGSHADYVASSSPASGEVGVYITGNILTIKPGSAGQRAISVDVSRGVA